MIKVRFSVTVYKDEVQVYHDYFFVASFPYDPIFTDYPVGVKNMMKQDRLENDERAEG